MRRRLSLPLLVCLLVCGACYALPKYRLAVAAMFQNEDRFLREWIEYHKLLGVEHFYLYDNLSEDNSFEVLQPYVASGEVTLIDWPHDHTRRHGRGTKWPLKRFNTIQIKAFNHAVRRADCEWLAVLDIDEFLVPATHTSLLEFLDSYGSDSEIAGLLLPWVMFGTSGVQEVPEDQLMIELLVLHWPPKRGFYEAWAQNELLRRMKVFWHKSILRPQYVEKMLSAHHARYVSGKRDHYVPIEEAQINHYWTRDEAFLREEKIPRREIWGYDSDWCLSRAAVFTSQSILGERILRFVAPLRAAMNLKQEESCEET